MDINNIDNNTFRIDNVSYVKRDYYVVYNNKAGNIDAINIKNKYTDSDFIFNEFKTWKDLTYSGSIEFNSIYELSEYITKTVSYSDPISITPSINSTDGYIEEVDDNVFRVSGICYVRGDYLIDYSSRFGGIDSINLKNKYTNDLIFRQSKPYTDFSSPSGSFSSLQELGEFLAPIISYRISGSGGGGTNNYVTDVTFDSASGDLSLDRQGLSTLSASLDGRYIQSGSNISQFNNDSNYIPSGSNISQLNNDSNYVVSGSSNSQFTNDENYIVSGSGNSQLDNDSNYIISGSVISQLNNDVNYVVSGSSNSQFTNDENYIQSGSNISELNNDSNYTPSGSNISQFNNDSNYTPSGSNISQFNNDAGYITDSGSNNYVNSVSFDSGSGLFILDRIGLDTISASLDGRYAQSGSNISQFNNDAGYITGSVGWDGQYSGSAGITGSLTISGNLNAGVGTFSGNINANDGYFSRDDIAVVEIIGIDGTGGVVGTDTDHDLLLRRNNSTKLTLGDTESTFSNTVVVDSEFRLTNSVTAADSIIRDININNSALDNSDKRAFILRFKTTDGGTTGSRGGFMEFIARREDTALSFDFPMSIGEIGSNGQTVAFKQTTAWMNGDKYQRADAREDTVTTEARLHWYGVNDSGSSRAFKHAWYDGSTYINIDVASNYVTFDTSGGVRAQNSSEWAALRYNGVRFNRSASYLIPESNDTLALYVGGFSAGQNDWTDINFFSTGQFRINGSDIWHTGNDDSLVKKTTSINNTTGAFDIGAGSSTGDIGYTLFSNVNPGGTLPSNYSGIFTFYGDGDGRNFALYKSNDSIGAGSFYVGLAANDGTLTWQEIWHQGSAPDLDDAWILNQRQDGKYAWIRRNSSGNSPLYVTQQAGSGHIQQWFQGAGDGSEVARVENNGTINATALTSNNAVTYGSIVQGPATSNRDKLRVYSSTLYTIGMQSGISFGALNSDWGMTFQMNNDSDRGFWWGDDGHSTAQGAMSLSTNGYLTLANHMRVGYGESDTTAVSTTYTIQANGTMQASNFILSSDRRLKKNIKKYTPKPIKIQWKEFDWKDKEKGHQLGLIAQEVQKNHPEFVIKDDQGLLSVKYTEVLIAKMAEKDEQIEELSGRIERLEFILKNML